MLVDFAPHRVTVHAFNLNDLPNVNWGPGELSDQDVYAHLITEVNFTPATFRNYLVPVVHAGERGVPWGPGFSRVKAVLGTRCGIIVASGLHRDFLGRRERSALEEVFHANGINHICFFGDVLTTPGGNKGIVTLRRFNTGKWYVRGHMSCFNFTDGMHALVLPKVES